MVMNSSPSCHTAPVSPGSDDNHLGAGNMPNGYDGPNSTMPNAITQTDGNAGSISQTTPQLPPAPPLAPPRAPRPSSGPEEPEPPRLIPMHTHRTLIRDFKALLEGEIAQGKDYAGVVSRVVDLFCDHEARVMHAERTGDWSPAVGSDGRSLWSSGVKADVDGLDVMIQGPRREDIGSIVCENAEHLDAVVR